MYHIIDKHIAAFYLWGKAGGLFYVAGPERSAQAKRRLVGQLNSLLLILRSDHCCQGTKGLFLESCHPGCYAAQQGRGKVTVCMCPTSQKLRPLLQALL